MKKRRRLASVETEIARVGGLDQRHPVFIGGAWRVDQTMPAPPDPRYEVIREHAETGRVQLAGWNIEGQDEAERLAETLNARVEAMGGLTLASSGLLERGWVYSSRRSSS